MNYITDYLLCSHSFTQINQILSASNSKAYNFISQRAVQTWNGKFWMAAELRDKCDQRCCYDICQAEHAVSRRDVIPMSCRSSGPTLVIEGDASNPIQSKMNNSNFIFWHPNIRES